jgi:hypothetical protein
MLLSHPLPPQAIAIGGASLPSQLSPSILRECLLPLLPVRELLRLSTTCKALRDLIRSCPTDLGDVWPEDLPAALRSFTTPTAFHLLSRPTAGLDHGQLTEVLTERGGSLERITWDWEAIDPAPLHSALRAGLLPRLTTFQLDMGEEQDCVLIIEGRLTGMRKLSLFNVDINPALLSLLEECASLTSLSLSSFIDPIEPFLPPTLRELRVTGEDGHLLAQLPGWLLASRVALETFTLHDTTLPLSYDGEALTKVLTMCGASLKVFEFTVLESPFVVGPEKGSVLAGLAACVALERLVMPMELFEAPLPPYVIFPRLTHLSAFSIRDSLTYLRDSPTGVNHLWGLMARGGLPSLLHLDIKARGREDLLGLAALPGVAATLRYLRVDTGYLEGIATAALSSFGHALGKLHQLRHLVLRIASDGEAYMAIARSVAKGGLPRLHTLDLGQVRWFVGRAVPAFELAISNAMSHSKDSQFVVGDAGSRDALTLMVMPHNRCTPPVLIALTWMVMPHRCTPGRSAWPINPA